MTEIYLYNTLSRTKEKFEPIDSNNVRMYVCGPTVYDYAHIGNARPVVVFDTLYRLLKRYYSKVTYVRNITDVDDKIMNRSKEAHVSIEEITNLFTDTYHYDMLSLNALYPDIEPRATQHITEMIELIKILLDKGNAYVANNEVLFDINSVQNYGGLSLQQAEDLIPGARVASSEHKRNSGDFILWKPSSDNQPGWDSPWGRGRPGWHIECSAMSKKHLGVSFDIHGGGIDLVFPHHENEIRQSFCANDSIAPAKYWLHNGFVEIDGSIMSKSKQNFLTVNELLKDYDGEVIRLFLLSAHYRQPLEFKSDSLSTCKKTLDRWYNALNNVFLSAGDVPDIVGKALKDDLNTPEAIAAIHEIVDEIFKSSDEDKLVQLRIKLISAGQSLGLLNKTKDEWFKSGQINNIAHIEEQIRLRNEAKSIKNYIEADRIRKSLEEENILLEDTSNGTIWRKK